MAIIEVTSSDVKSIIEIHNREEANYQKDFETVKAKRINELRNNKLSKKIIELSPLIVPSLIVLFIFISEYNGWISKSISVNAIASICVAMVFSFMFLFTKAANNYNQFEDSHYNHYNATLSKQDASLLIKLHDKFDLSGKDIQYKEMVDGQFSIPFRSIKNLKNKVIKQAHIINECK